jgi:hypothetical protein
MTNTMILPVVRVEKKGYITQEDEILVHVNRSSPWGNPFTMKKESARNEVCNLFEHHMANELTHNPEKWEALNTSVEVYIKLKLNVVLICHCHPKRCHADTIAAWLNMKIQERIQERIQR